MNTLPISCKIPKKIFVFIVAVLCLFPADAAFQDVLIEEKSIYTDADGNVFVNKNLELYLFVSAEEKNELLLMEPEASDNKKIRINQHGLNKFVHENPITGEASTFEFFADGVAPTTDIVFTKGLVMRYENRFYCSDSAYIAFNAHDKASGVRQTYFSLNKEEFQIFDDNKILLPEMPHLKISYYSVDNVGNVEQTNIANVFFDIESVISLENIYFELNSAELTPDSREQLNILIKTLEEFPELRIKLMSHTDSRGAAAYNLRLSRLRAESVKNYLVANGVHPSRLETKGYGDTKLLNDCLPGVECTEEEHRVNRRTEFKIIHFDE